MESVKSRLVKSSLLRCEENRMKLHHEKKYTKNKLLAKETTTSKKKIFREIIVCKVFQETESLVIFFLGLTAISCELSVFKL